MFAKLDIKWYALYSYWQLIWTVLFKSGAVPLSPYPSLLGTVLFLPLVFFGVQHINVAAVAINYMLHVFVLLLVEPDLRPIAVWLNLCVFLTYILFLRFLKKDFFVIYFTDIRGFLGQKGLTLNAYAKSYDQWIGQSVWSGA